MLSKEAKNIQNHLNTIIDTIPGSVYWKNKEGVYLGCNNIIIEKGNLKNKAALIGKTDFDVWPEQANEIRKNDMQVMESGETLEIEETVILPNGKKMYFASIKAPLRDENGNIIGVAGNSLDITELKEAKERAEIASRAKTQFLAVASHELRIPLAGIITTASMMVDGYITPQELPTVGKIILESGNYLLSHVNSILDFAKLEADKFELALIPLDLKNHIEEIVAMLKASAKTKGLDLIINYGSNTPHNIVSDPLALQQILINLIHNAIRYTEKGHIIVKVTCLKKTLQTAELEIAIEDTGKGVPADRYEFIFDKFTQLEDAYVRKNSQSGIGLGLSITKKLVNLLKGNIRIESTVGKGSTFFFTAEFFLADKTLQKIHEASSATMIKPHADNHKINILMVEDDKIIQHIQKSMLNKIGCQVNVIDTGDKAIEEITNGHSYDLFLIDIGLPDISGYEVIENIQKYNNANGKEIPIIALTGYIGDEEKKLCLKAGANEVVHKPVTSTIMQDIINRRKK